MGTPRHFPHNLHHMQYVEDTRHEAWKDAWDKLASNAVPVADAELVEENGSGRWIAVILFILLALVGFSGYQVARVGLGYDGPVTLFQAKL